MDCYYYVFLGPEVLLTCVQNVDKQVFGGRSIICTNR